MKTKIKVGSDFSGIGAFECALNRLGVEYNNIFACDIDKYARDSYLSNHNTLKMEKDVYTREIPKEPLDIYMTSPPCQAFSQNGKRLGESDVRGVLFYNSLEFIKKNNPKVFIFENVKGLLSASGGEIFKRWIEELNNLGNYKISYRILNSKDFGVAQNRERVFILGSQEGLDIGEFQFPTFPEVRLGSVLEKEVANKYYCDREYVSIPCDFSKHGIHHTHKIPSFKYECRNKVHGITGICRTLTAGRGGNVDPFIIDDVGLRRLTPLECWRLQGFTDEEFNNTLVSDTQLYKQAGNSITVTVLVEILRGILL